MLLGLVPVFAAASDWRQMCGECGVIGAILAGSDQGVCHCPDLGAHVDVHCYAGVPGR